MSNKPCFLDTKDWRDAIIRMNQQSLGSDNAFPGRGEYIHLITGRGRLQREITDFLAGSDNICSPAADLLRKRVISRRNEWQQWFVETCKVFGSIVPGTLLDPQNEPLLTGEICGHHWVLTERNWSLYTSFCNGLALANFAVLCFEVSRPLIDQCVFLAHEVLRIVEYVKWWEPEKLSTAMSGARVAHLSLKTSQEWSEDISRRAGISANKFPGSMQRKLSFQLWKSHLKGLGVRVV